MVLPAALLASFDLAAPAHRHPCSSPFFAMSYLYKRSNRMWRFLIRHQLTATMWCPLVEWTRRRHVKFRRRLAAQTDSAGHSRAWSLPQAFDQPIRRIEFVG